MAKRKPKLLTGQLPVPALDGDVARDVAFSGASVQVISVQGGREYQEDRFLVSALEIDAKDAPAFLAETFRDAARKTDTNRAGSTGTGLVLTKDLQLNAAYLGDSPVVVFVRDPKTGGVDARKLTRDHHAAEPSEKARIEAEGGIVAFNGRVQGSLMLSRAFGDDRYIGVSREPEFATADLKKEIDAGKDVYVCLSSDGLYETLDPADYIAPLNDAIAQGKEQGLAAIFAAHAHEKGSRDNITVLTLKVSADMKDNLFLAIADGHGGGKTSKQVIESFEDSLARRKKPAAPRP